MSNTMKKVAALVLTLALVLAVMPTAMAGSAVYVLHLKPRVMATEAPAAEATAAPDTTVAETVTTTAAVTWQKDENGNLVLDENGNPVANVPAGQETPVAYEKDENGNLVLDENGNPVVTDTIPADSDKISTLVDELDPNRTIDIYVSWNGGEAKFGNTATLIAVLNGYGNNQCSIQWQTSPDDATWTDVADGNGTHLDVVVTEDNYLDYWRVVVTVADAE